MAQDQLRMILAAEAEARQQFEAAAGECQRLLAQAEEEGRCCVREAREGRDALARSVEQQIVAEAEEKAWRVAEGTHARATAMQAHAAARMDAAVEIVLRCVLGSEVDDDG